MFSSGGVRRWRWQRDEMAAKQPTAARIQSTAGYFQWASGTFYSHVCGDRPRFYLLFFWEAFHGFIWQDILETDDRKWDKREGITCSLDALLTEVQANPKPRYSSAKWGLSLTLTKCFLCLTRSEPQKNTNYYTEMFSKYEPYKCLFVVCRKVQHQQLLWRSVTYKHANIC